jgi:hypothetical protein
MPWQVVPIDSMAASPVHWALVVGIILLVVGLLLFIPCCYVGLVVGGTPGVSASDRRDYRTTMVFGPLSLVGTGGGLIAASYLVDKERIPLVFIILAIAPLAFVAGRCRTRVADRAVEAEHDKERVELQRRQAEQRERNLEAYRREQQAKADPV